MTPSKLLYSCSYIQLKKQKLLRTLDLELCWLICFEEYVPFIAISCTYFYTCRLSLNPTKTLMEEDAIGGNHGGRWGRIYVYVSKYSSIYKRMQL